MKMRVLLIMSVDDSVVMSIEFSWMWLTDLYNHPANIQTRSQSHPRSETDARVSSRSDSLQPWRRCLPPNSTDCTSIPCANRCKVDVENVRKYSNNRDVDCELSDSISTMWIVSWLPWSALGRSRLSPNCDWLLYRTNARCHSRSSTPLIVGIDFDLHVDNRAALIVHFASI